MKKVRDMTRSQGWLLLILAAAEGAARRSQVTFDEWEVEFSRLMGIMGKCLDEEVLGSELRNPEFFTRFKRRHPRQAALLHFNGNARDPRYHAQHYHPSRRRSRFPDRNRPLPQLERRPCAAGYCRRRQARLGPLRSMRHRMPWFESSSTVWCWPTPALHRTHSISRPFHQAVGTSV